MSSETIQALIPEVPLPSATSSPFLDVKSFTADAAPNPAASPVLSASPFRTVYQLEGEGESLDPNIAQRLEFAGELQDEEFDHAVFEAVAEASALRDLAGETDGDRVLRQHFSTLQRELENAIDAAADRFARSDLKTMDRSEAEAFFDGYSTAQEMGPAFENLFGGLLNKLKKVATGAINLAKNGVASLANLALGPLLNRLKPLVPVMLKKVLEFARNKIPAQFQPILTQLAQRFGVKMELAAEGEDAHGSGIGEIQNEFDAQVASAVLAPGEVERDLEVARQSVESQLPQRDPLADLDRARSELTERLSQLKEGESAAPAFENFIPLLLPVLGMGIKMIGRPRVVNFLAKLLGGLLGNFLGPLNTPALSQAIVDAGLKLIHLETTPETAETAARSAIVSTVEDTVRRVAALPEYMLDDHEMLEGAALEAFESAAAANLPPVLSQDTYRARPELRESATFPGTWILHPIGGRHRYKKFSRVLRVRITPEKARAAETFEGSNLAEFLEEQMGLAPGAELEANVHLYETLPGAMLPDIARMERDTPGLGSSAEVAYGQLHPLTPTTAGLVTGEPGLGRHASPASLAGRQNTGPGQRFYHLSMPGIRPPGSPAGPGHLRRHSRLHVTLDLTKDEIRVRLYLAESRAQKLLVKLRQQGHVGLVLAAMRPMLEKKLELALTPRQHGGVKVIHPDVTPQQANGAILQKLPAALTGALRFHLLHWILKALKGFFETQAPQVLAAIETPHDGVTFKLKIHAPPGLAALRDALKGRAVLAGAAAFQGAAPTTDVTVAPGHTHHA
jgi:hypothetical protein